MSKLTKAHCRALAFIALALLIQVHAASSVIDAETGRNLALCTQGCNALKDLCVIECPVDCTELFPPGEERDACIEGCQGTCVLDMQVCKSKCNVHRPDISPTSP